MSAPPCIRTTRRRAIAVGGGTIDRERERIALPVDLVATAIGGLPDLAAAALLGLELVGTDATAAAARGAREQARRGACRALRLSQRALEAHARDGGYDWRPWVDAAIQATAFELDEALIGGEGRTSLEHTAELAHQFGEATRALAYDRMAVPEALSAAQTQALVLVVMTEEDGRRAP
ncbi:MAG: hypothetical protein JWM31_2111 [Solirubrobacterales bacterium]|nr:hypothetical protein [Solirubrobacterales bacterium]